MFAVFLWQDRETLARVLLRRTTIPNHRESDTMVRSGLVCAAVLSTSVAVAGPGTARAQVIEYIAAMSGPNESPPTTSTATGNVIVDFNPSAHTLRIRGSFQGLTSNTAAAHIHAATATPLTGTAGVATVLPAPPGFPIGVTSGTFDSTLNTLTDAAYNPAYETANGGTAASAEQALQAALFQGKAYFNIHTTNFGGGEIRGFLVLAPVPEPGTLALTGVAFAGVLAYRRRRRT
jgi:hypothetical protein